MIFVVLAICLTLAHQAVETFTWKHRRWLWWVRKYRIGMVLWCAYTVVVIPLILLKVIPPGNMGIAISLFLSILAVLLFSWWHKLFPWAVLIVRQEQSWLKKYQEEIRTIGVLFGMIVGLGALLFYLANVLPKIG